ncbi:MAG TPA: AgmX/PglI C-terminal domain-containing protein [Polyangiaceae bacterium]|nr:AgmX/PglI C-terminal domain-containing protein [Polyangiaceae bacterium]
MTQGFQQQPSAGSSQRPGQMTAVMRAVAATGPKVLRIGVVQGGRVSEERIIKQRTHVTVGPSEKNMFVLATSNVPATFRLFELVGNDYHLNFLDGMTGRIALPTGISDLSLLKGQARRTSQGAYQIRLTEDSRGKIVIGETTFLFQFVAPPPIQPKPQLPVAVLRGASAIDWNTTIIAAVSFLLHFLLLGSIYSDWLDPVVDDELSVAGVIDSLKSLPPPPPVEDKPEKPDDSKATEKAPEKPAAPAPAAAPGPKAPAGHLNEKQAAALHNELDQLEMATLGALSSSGPATAGVLKGSEVATSALDQAAASSAGVGVGTGDLKLGSGGGAIRPGMGNGLAGIGSSGRTTGTEGTGTGAKVAGPKGNANVGGAAVSGGTVSNASRVVAGMRAGFRACYQRALAENPDAAGNITLTIRVGAGGEVTSVGGSSGSLPPSVVACVKARAQAAQFDAPEGGSAVISVPVTFVKQ